MRYVFKILFHLILLTVILILVRYRSKKFSFIGNEKIRDYPVRRYKIGSLILLLWMDLPIFGLAQEIIFKSSMDSRLFLIPLVPTIIYHLFGALPSVMKSKYRIDLTLNWVNRGAVGFDWLGSWIGVVFAWVLLVSSAFAIYYLNPKKIDKTDNSEEEK